VKRSELKDEDIIIGAQINENSVNHLVNTYGTRFFTAARADRPGVLLDRTEWRVDFGTDVLELEALKQMRQKMRGGGVKPKLSPASKRTWAVHEKGGSEMH
jgi:hypothetical protein